MRLRDGDLNSCSVATLSNNNKNLSVTGSTYAVPDSILSSISKH